MNSCRTSIPRKRRGKTNKQTNKQRAARWQEIGGPWKVNGHLQEGEEGQAKITSLGEEGAWAERIGERVDPKVVHEDLQSLRFTPSLAKPDMVKEVGSEGPIHKMTQRNELG